MKITPTVIAASATLNPEVPVAPIGVDEIEHVARGGAVDQVADGAAEHGGHADAGQAIRQRHCGAYHATPPSAIIATSDSTSVFNGESTAFSMPNAAPVL